MDHSVGITSFKSHKEWFFADDDLEWWCQAKMGIRETRLLHNAITAYLEIWPGGDQQRPNEERKFLEYQKNRLFGMIMEYNYNHPK